MALIEEGNYDYNENDSVNPGFEAFMDAMIEREINGPLHYTEMPRDDFGEGGGGSSNSIPDKFEVMSPLLKTKWSQESPYNTYCSTMPSMQKKLLYSMTTQKILEPVTITDIN